MASQQLTSSEYIQHHLQHWQTTLGFEPTIQAAGTVDFGVINIDTIFYSVFLGILVSFILWRVARKATSGVPSRTQAAVEILVEMISKQVALSIPRQESRLYVSALALTIFVWVFVLNAMDLVPVDLLPWAWSNIYGAMGGDPHHAYMRVVSTADVSAALGMSIAILLICLAYGLKVKGLGSFGKELISHPFPMPKNIFGKCIIAIFNLLMQLIEYLSKTVSHGMRLFGNMYAGELVFMLIALMGGAAAASLTGVFLPLGHVIAGSIWAIFHIIIITLQAFIFMMLALIYLGQAHAQEAH